MTDSPRIDLAAGTVDRPARVVFVHPDEPGSVTIDLPMNLTTVAALLSYLGGLGFEFAKVDQ